MHTLELQSNQDCKDNMISARLQIKELLIFKNNISVHFYPHNKTKNHNNNEYSKKENSIYFVCEINSKQDY